MSDLVFKKMHDIGKDVLAFFVMFAFIFTATTANAATFTLDVTEILSGISVIVAAVTSIGLAALSVVLVVKAFKYVKSAF